MHDTDAILSAPDFAVRFVLSGRNGRPPHLVLEELGVPADCALALIVEADERVMQAIEATHQVMALTLVSKLFASAMQDDRGALLFYLSRKPPKGWPLLSQAPGGAPLSQADVDREVDQMFQAWQGKHPNTQ